MNKDKKIVITGQLVVRVVAILGFIASILLFIFESDKKFAIIFLVLSILLFFSANRLSNNKNEN